MAEDITWRQRQAAYFVVSLLLGAAMAFVGGGWIILAPILNPRLLKSGTTVYDLAGPCLLLWLSSTLAMRGLIHLIIQKPEHEK